MDESFDNDETYGLPDFSLDEREKRTNHEYLESQESKHKESQIQATNR